jgi:DNA (cytosine-5)-methyltransferase 1
VLATDLSDKINLGKKKKAVDLALHLRMSKAKNELVTEFSKRCFSLVSLFAGAGGMDIGFEKADFKTVWANEYDKTIAPSYQKYFPKTQFDGRSIRDIPDDDLPETVTGVIGGPPCQSWSEAGARRGLDDPRGALFFEYLRVIKRTKPMFFVAENVHGLIHARNMASFQHIIRLFETEGYVVSWKLLRASDYGVPQDRERVFIVGYHRSLNKVFKFPEPLESKTTLRQAIGDLADLEIGNTEKVKNHEFMESGYSPIFMSRNRVRSWDEQSYTILATDRHIPFHPQAPKMVKVEGQKFREFAKGFEQYYRRLTIRECARIQTFPDDYEFIYTNMRNAYKMIGNAVPIDLAYFVAKKIKEDLV